MLDLLHGRALGALVRLSLSQLALLIPPAPVADEGTVRIPANGRLLTVVVIPHPITLRLVVAKFAGRRNLAVLMPVRERAGLLTLLVGAFLLQLAVRIPELGRAVP